MIGVGTRWARKKCVSEGTIRLGERDLAGELHAWGDGWGQAPSLLKYYLYSGNSSGLIGAHTFPGTGGGKDGPRPSFPPPVQKACEAPLALTSQ